MRCRIASGWRDRKSTRLNSSHTVIYTLSLHDALPISPGPLDRERGIVIVTPNLGWRNFPLRDEVSNRVGLAASLDNDANCATLGEWWCGAAKGARHVVGLT